MLQNYTATILQPNREDVYGVKSKESKGNWFILQYFADAFNLVTNKATSDKLLVTPGIESTAGYR